MDKLDFGSYHGGNPPSFVPFSGVAAVAPAVDCRGICVLLNCLRAGIAVWVMGATWEAGTSMPSRQAQNMQRLWAEDVFQ